MKLNGTKKYIVDQRIFCLTYWPSKNFTKYLFKDIYLVIWSKHLSNYSIVFIENVEINLTGAVQESRSIIGI